MDTQPLEIRHQEMVVAREQRALMATPVAAAGVHSEARVRHAVGDTVDQNGDFAEPCRAVLPHDPPIRDSERGPIHVPQRRRAIESTLQPASVVPADKEAASSNLLLDLDIDKPSARKRVLAVRSHRLRIAQPRFLELGELG